MGGKSAFTQIRNLIIENWANEVQKYKHKLYLVNNEKRIYSWGMKYFLESIGIHCEPWEMVGMDFCMLR